MGKVNVVKLLEILEGLHTLLELCWDLSKNPELTDLLETAISRLEITISTVLLLKCHNNIAASKIN